MLVLVFALVGAVVGVPTTNYTVTKYTFTRENDTDVIEPEAPPFQLIPLDFLCEFCQVVILKLKDRQLNEPDFEEKIKQECFNSTDSTSSICDVINRVNLGKLRNDEPRAICAEQKMCIGSVVEKQTAMPSASPSPTTVVGEKRVETNIHVLDPDPTSIY
ncbi:unnamed protein product [Caenorhabditis bovis]|uniref:Saposin B-type domain-containing protein n=1 Tax=Caenorhabditis bovis TaxID=2654633 RepID=A0A8S1EZL8_9PELO|nr:unnamed protein product [Caenorhabditis bovis]